MAENQIYSSAIASALEYFVPTFLSLQPSLFCLCSAQFIGILGKVKAMIIMIIILKEFIIRSSKELVARKCSIF